MDIDPVSGALFGVNPASAPGVIERIDPRTGTVAFVTKVRLTRGAASVIALAFSPEGQLYGARGRTLGTIDTDTGVFLPVVEVPDCDLIAGIDFSPEGVLYAVSKRSQPSEQFLLTINAATGETTSVVRTGTYAVGDIDYAPDGFIYATNFSWALLRIDPANKKARAYRERARAKINEQNTNQ